MKIIACQATLAFVYVTKLLVYNVIYRIAMKIEMPKGPSILGTLYYTYAYQRIGHQCVMQSLQNFSGHMYVFVWAFGCVCVRI